IVQLKYAGALDRLSGLLFISFFFVPLAGSKRGSGRELNAVPVSLGFIKHIVKAILIMDNVAINARFAIFREKQLFGLSFQIGKVLFSISIVNNIWFVSVFICRIKLEFIPYFIIYSLHSQYAL